jgi:N,N-dimethylformamidase beta subunit-like protein
VLGFRKRDRSRLLLLAALVLGLSLVTAMIFQLATAKLIQGTRKKTATANPIQQENSLPGTSAWQVKKPSSHGEIQAYAGEDSVHVGGQVDLHVSTLVPETYDIQIYRLGYYHDLGGRLMQDIPDNPSSPQGYYEGINAFPTACPTCTTSALDSLGQETSLTKPNWRVSTMISFSPNWISGVYLIKLIEQIGHYEWNVPIVVRNDSSVSDIVYNYPIYTDQAYNFWGGAGFYHNFRPHSPPIGFAISLGRPLVQWAGTGNLFFWTYQMIRFLEEQGYDVSYATDESISNGTTNLLNHKVVVTGGHDEYYTYSERRAIQHASASGVSVAYFGGNTMYWQIRADEKNRVLTCYKEATFPTYRDPLDTPDNPLRYLSTTQWRDPPLNSPEDGFLKEMFGNWSEGPLAGYGVHINQDLRLQSTQSWVYWNTNAHDGQLISGILGDEVDILFADSSIGPNDRLTIVAQSPFLNIKKQRLLSFSLLDELSNNAVMFDAGTIYWPLGLSDYLPKIIGLQNPIPESAVLRQMTNNILYRMITSAYPGRLTPTPPPVYHTSVYCPGATTGPCNITLAPAVSTPAPIPSPAGTPGPALPPSIPTRHSSKSSKIPIHSYAFSTEGG